MAVAMTEICGEAARWWPIRTSGFIMWLGKERTTWIPYALGKN
jgi:hypothetical protein